MKNIQVKEFSYGKITQSLKSAIIWLNRRKKTLSRRKDWFEYPDYWDMPRKISSRLSDDEVDFLQYETYDWTQQ